MKSREELKMEIIESINNGGPKYFEIKKVELSEEYKEFVTYREYPKGKFFGIKIGWWY